jgi:hypothetical protein
LNNAVLSAAVFVPYPVLYRFPYPHAPPARKQLISILVNREKGDDPAARTRAGRRSTRS